MNRRAKRNKYKNETAKLNIVINKFKDVLNDANWENTKLSCELDKSKKETKKYQDKYY